MVASEIEGVVSRWVPDIAVPDKDCVVHRCSAILSTYLFNFCVASSAAGMDDVRHSSNSDMHCLIAVNTSKKL